MTWRTRQLLHLGLGCLLLAAGPTHAQESNPLQESIRQNTEKLSGLRTRIKAQQARMATLESEAKAVRRSHAEIQQEIEASRRLLSETVQSELTLATQSEELAAAVAVHQAQYDAQRRALGGSLRRMYLRSQRGELEMALTSGSFSDLMTRMKVSRMLARLEAEVVENTRREGARIAVEQRLLDSARAEIWQTREEKRSENERLESLMAEQAAALRDLDTERKGLKAQLTELSLNEQKLNYVLEDLDQQRTETDARRAVPATTTLAGLAGQMEWPVRGELIRGFGRSVHPRFKTVTVNNGVNVAAPLGSPVAAAADGKVEFSDDLPGFGQCVILDHGAGYYTLYAYLDRVFVAKGDVISRGQVVAEVGRPTGDEEPQLYFEVRQGRTPLDPADWLKSR
jgi:septal ring factor EnvC (AmiA/AmiB activator)